MSEKDSLQRFLFKEANIRGEIVRLNNTYHAVTERHPYPINIKQYLGQGLAASALLSATIKFSGRLTIQTQSDGLINLLVVQSDDQFNLRGLAKWLNNDQISNLHDILGNGLLAITIAPSEGERYQGIVELDGDSLAKSLENYFHQSEQLPTCLYLFANAEIAGGILLQALPADTTEDRYNYWQHLKHLTNTLTADELLKLNNETILRRLFHEEEITLFEAHSLQFKCDCSIQKMENAMLILGKAEIDEIFHQQEQVDVTCEFCNYKYCFTKKDIETIFKSN